MRYAVVKSVKVREFEKRVSELLDIGWELYGNLVVFVDWAGQTTYIQAVVHK